MASVGQEKAAGTGLAADGDPESVPLLCRGRTPAAEETVRREAAGWQAAQHSRGQAAETGGGAEQMRRAALWKFPRECEEAQSAQTQGAGLGPELALLLARTWYRATLELEQRRPHFRAGGYALVGQHGQAFQLERAGTRLRPRRSPGPLAQRLPAPARSQCEKSVSSVQGGGNCPFWSGKRGATAILAPEGCFS